MRLPSLLKHSILGLSLLTAYGANAQITVTPNQTGTDLMDYITGTNVTVSNAVLTCAGDANGTFVVSGSSLLGLDSGIVLTTGVVSASSGFGVLGTGTDLATTMNGTAGDPDLSATIGGTTFDACRLEFDFVSTFDTVLFYYSFGSEEYPIYNCSAFNDVFGFYISGPGITGLQNMALVPGTNIPVAINSINDGTNLGVNCTNMGAGAPFTSLYVDNSAGTDLTYNGFTTVLEAKAPVTTGSTYHMVMAVADVMDGVMDSGVFLRGSSFTSKPAIPTSVPQDPKNAKFIIAPSPSEEFISIYVGNDVYGKNVAACIQNELGQSVYNYNGTSANLSADMKLRTTTLAPGNYFVTISVTGEGLREVKKVQKLK